jgi:(1->4)-alpha-D-glucan 1-alpha-D-glucosylmutase
MYTPASTYRIQLHKDFNFKNLQEILGYLYDLGVSTIYASPITKAVKGSMHGYDDVNPLELNPEIGTMEEWESIQAELKQKNMGWLQDIVPNHMAFDLHNKWIFDLLERGRLSGFYDFFDIIPQQLQSQATERIMVPFLKKPLEQCIAENEIRLVYKEAGFFLKYGDKLYPVSINCYHWICSVLPGFFRPLLAWSQKLDSYTRLPFHKWIYFKERIMAEIGNIEHLKAHVNASMEYINQRPEMISLLLEFQHYQLVHWKVSQHKMNYRRFFAVNSLICLRMENENVYNRWHSFLFALYHAGFIQGFRVDHVDGLFNPAEYLSRLRNDTGEEAYIIVEKILYENEKIREDWPVQGTTGYDFLSMTNQLFTNEAGKRKLLEYYRTVFSPEKYRDIVFEKKYAFLKTEMYGELKNLIRWLIPWLSLNQIETDMQELTEGLAVFMAAMPVYRIYAEGLPLNKMDRQYIDKAFRLALNLYPRYKEQFIYLRNVFDTHPDHVSAEQALLFVRRFSQYTGPLAAKGTEDTVFYNYNVLLAQNEVGDSPDHEPVTVDCFHEMMMQRREKANYALNASSTHDTKRGEDNRLRINLISVYADEWIEIVKKIKEISKSFIETWDEIHIPSEKDEYLIYQSLVGSIPVNLDISTDFLESFKAYLRKAQREEKVESAWDSPNSEYEDRCFGFVLRLLKSSAFKYVFFPFLDKILKDVSLYSLSQTALKLTAPGIPDIYQGAELWDLSLVDPDNRKPVDFLKRKNLMEQIVAKETGEKIDLLDFVSANAAEGAQKLLLIRKILLFRKKHAELFNQGEYIPVPGGDKWLAYIRKYEGEQIMVIAPLPGRAAGRKYDSPTGISGRWKNLISGQQVQITNFLDPVQILKEFPVAVLQLQND